MSHSVGLIWIGGRMQEKKLNSEESLSFSSFETRELVENFPEESKTSYELTGNFPTVAHWLTCSLNILIQIKGLLSFLWSKKK
jgi:hypothetical protein